MATGEAASFSYEDTFDFYNSYTMPTRAAWDYYQSPRVEAGNPMWPRGCDVTILKSMIK